MSRRALTFCLAAVVVASCGTAPVAPATTGPSQPGADTGAASQTPWSTPTAVAPPSPDTCAETTLAAMSEAQRVGQLFMFGIAGDRPSRSEEAALTAYHLGSVWLVHNRSGGVAAVKSLATRIQGLATASNTAGAGFFVAADQEGGLVQRLKGDGFSTIPSALDQGQLPAAGLQADATTWGRELSSAGINLNLAPVMDVVPPGGDATNAPIGALQREFGHDPATVGSHGAAMVEGMAAAGIATTLKHFPGLGRVTGNTDTASGVVDATTTADDPYLDAFAAGIAAGVPFVMVSLATYTAIDPDHQAVFSPAIIGGLLRQRLGFRGVVMSDDLGAAASVGNLSPGDRATAFIAAGGDLMIVQGSTQTGQMVAAVVARVGSDTAFAAQVDAAALLVLRAKEHYGLVRCD